jgi:cephalosporin-C deacetylase-like acetyl esterase
MAYFDAVFAAKRVTCPVSIDSAGLGDYVSPPSSLAVLYNCLSVPKKIVWLQGKTHGFTPPNVAKWVVDGSYGR